MLDLRWLIALVLLDSLAIRLGQPLLALACTFCLLYAAVVMLSQRHCLKGVSYRRSLSCARAGQGEVIELTATFDNHKLMPLSLLEIEDDLPRHVSLSGGIVRETAAGRPCLYVARPMLPYTRVIRHLKVRCERRGVHRFGPARFRAGDFLSLAVQHGGEREDHELLVLPKVFPLDPEPAASRRLLGRLRARQLLLADPLRKLGPREFRTGDPLRMIDWRTTARRTSLMVREIEPSTTPAVQFILNFRLHSRALDPVEPDELEFAISVTASLIAYARRRGIAVGLCGNGYSAGKPLALPAGHAPEQLKLALELLARATSRPSCTLPELLRAQRASLRREDTWLVVTDRLDAVERHALIDAQRRGQPVELVLTSRLDGSDNENENENYGPLRATRFPYQEGWSERDALSVVA